MRNLLEEMLKENYKSVTDQFKEEIKEYLDDIEGASDRVVTERKLMVIESLENFLMLERLKL